MKLLNTKILFCAVITTASLALIGCEKPSLESTAKAAEAPKVAAAPQSKVAESNPTDKQTAPIPIDLSTLSLDTTQPSKDGKANISTGLIPNQNLSEFKISTNAFSSRSSLGARVFFFSSLDKLL